MSKKTLTAKVDDDLMSLVELAVINTGKSKSTLTNEALRAYLGTPAATQYPSGTKLPKAWGLKPSLKQKHDRERYYIFPEDKVVAVLVTSPRRYLEVAIEYPDSIWTSIDWNEKESKQYPLTQLLMASTDTCKAAIEYGYRVLTYLASPSIEHSIESSDRYAEEYLDKILAVDAPIALEEPMGTPTPTPNTISTDELLTIMGTRDEKRGIVTQTLMKVGTAKKDSIDTQRTKILGATGGYLPTDETRTQWVLSRESLVIS